MVGARRSRIGVVAIAIAIAAGCASGNARVPAPPDPIVCGGAFNSPALAMSWQERDPEEPPPPLPGSEPFLVGRTLRDAPLAGSDYRAGLAKLLVELPSGVVLRVDGVVLVSGPALGEVWIEVGRHVLEATTLSADAGEPLKGSSTVIFTARSTHHLVVRLPP